MVRSLRRRVERLEKVSGGNSEPNLQALARRIDIAPERFAAVAQDEKWRLGELIGKDGMVTWEGFCELRELGLLSKVPVPRKA